jgi:hypothetical protein
MRILGPNIFFVVLGTLLILPAGHAQAPGENSAGPAVQPIASSPVVPLFTSDTNKALAGSATSVSNSHPLAGAQELSLENPELRRSYWQLFFNLTSTLDTNPLGVGNSFHAVPWGSLYGGADLHLSSHRSDLSVDYLGGGVLSRYSNEDAPIQQLVLGEKLTWRRAAISLFDQFGYFPEAVSQVNLPASPDLTGNRQTTLQPVFLPNQSIATTLGQELNNTFVGELDVNPTQRSSLTFLESYSVARFFQADLLDLNDTILQAGFNHQLTRNNSVAVLYRFTGFRFTNFYQPMDGHEVQLAFGRRIAGRLAIQLSAGSELAVFRTAMVSDASVSAAPTIAVSRSIYWTADSAITYEIRRTEFKLGYDHGLTDGAGFLAGAITDQIYGSVDSQLSRRLTGEVIGGYARNHGVTATPTQPTNQLYRNWFGGVTISHALSRKASIFLSYQLQRQATNFVCGGLGCGNDFTRQLISLGVMGRSQPRPIG